MNQNKFRLTPVELKKKANDLRIGIIETLAGLGSGHTGGPLGMAEVFAVLYFDIMYFDPSNPKDPNRDRFILSNGHICPLMYVCMAQAGYFPIEELKTLRQINSRLQGHPWNLSLPGVENSSGPLGQGISQAVGYALRAKLDKASHRIFCVVSDGEHQEGQFWEAMLFASAQKLDNLIIIVDNNNIEIDGYVDQIVPVMPLQEKYDAFLYDHFVMDGNDIPQVLEGIHKALDTIGDGKPKIIEAKTILGKGVPFMENNYMWHGIAPTIEQADQALAILRKNT
jgi:transketolase